MRATPPCHAPLLASPPPTPTQGVGALELEAMFEAMFEALRQDEASLATQQAMQARRQPGMPASLPPPLPSPPLGDWLPGLGCLPCLAAMPRPSPLASPPPTPAQDVQPNGKGWEGVAPKRKAGDDDGGPIGKRAKGRTGACATGLLRAALTSRWDKTSARPPPRSTQSKGSAQEIIPHAAGRKPEPVP